MTDKNLIRAQFELNYKTSVIYGIVCYIAYVVGMVLMIYSCYPWFPLTENQGVFIGAPVIVVPWVISYFIWRARRKKKWDEFIRREHLLFYNELKGLF